MTEPSGRRERKKAATRQKIADTALRLFLERGYDAVGIRDVAAEADVAVTTRTSSSASRGRYPTGLRTSRSSRRFTARSRPWCGTARRRAVPPSDA